MLVTYTSPSLRTLQQNFRFTLQPGGEPVENQWAANHGMAGGDGSVPDVDHGLHDTPHHAVHTSATKLNLRPSIRHTEDSRHRSKEIKS
jgi:hypothetical protein